MSFKKAIIQSVIFCTFLTGCAATAVVGAGYYVGTSIYDIGKETITVPRKNKYSNEKIIFINNSTKFRVSLLETASTKTDDWKYSQSANNSRFKLEFLGRERIFSPGLYYSKNMSSQTLFIGSVVISDNKNIIEKKVWNFENGIESKPLGEMVASYLNSLSKFEKVK